MHRADSNTTTTTATTTITTTTTNNNNNNPTPWGIKDNNNISTEGQKNYFNNNTNANVYGAVIMAKPLREFTRFI